MTDRVGGPRPRLGAKLAMAGLAAVVALLICELAARMMFPRPPDSSRQPSVGYRYDAEVGYVPLPDQRAWIDEGSVTVNSIGARGADVPLPKPAGRRRIVVIGDSLTLGWGVNDSQTYSAELERRLRETTGGAAELDVVNLGVSGYNTRQAVAWLERHVERLQPDVVVLGFYSNDVPDAIEDGASGTRIATERPTGDRVLYITANRPDWWSRQLRKSRAIYVAGRAFNRLRGAGEWGMSRFAMEIEMLEGRSSPDLDRAWSTVRTQFDRLKALSVTHRFRVAVVVLPSREQVMGKYANASFQTQVRALAAPLGFEVIDPLPVLIAHRTGADDLYVPYDRNHPSARGHALIGEAISAHLVAHGMLSPAR